MTSQTTWYGHTVIVANIKYVEVKGERSGRKWERKMGKGKDGGTELLWGKGGR
jgi:hypothetical protein